MKITYPQLTKHQSKTYARRPLAWVDRIIVHHFGGEITTEGAAHYHVYEKGWPGIGYHIVVEKDGSITLGNGFDRITYHCKGQNSRSIGIALQGNFTTNKVGQDQLSGLKQAIEIVNLALGRTVAIFPHSMFRPTECPGDGLRQWLSSRTIHNALHIAYNEQPEPAWWAKWLHDGKESW